jgi:hypothetical protein
VKAHRRKRSLSSHATAVLAALALLALPARSGAQEQGSAPEAAGSSRESTNEQLEGLARELREVAERHGPDAVALQAALLLETIRAGAVAASEVSVEGPAAEPHADHLCVRVLSGLIFDRRESTARSRLEQMWGRVAAPALGRMESFDIRPTSLELVLGFGVQDFSETDEGVADPALDYPVREVHLRLPADELASMASRSLGAGELFERAQIDAEQPWSAPPPPEPDSP